MPEVKGKQAKANTLTRLQRYTRDGIDPAVPPTGPADHLITYLWEIGPTMPSGMGAAPITHGEIRAWQDNTGIELATWEARLLRRLSIEHLTQSDLSLDANCAPPFGSLYRNPKLDSKIDAALD